MRLTPYRTATDPRAILEDKRAELLAALRDRERLAIEPEADLMDRTISTQRRDLGSRPALLRIASSMMTRFVSPVRFRLAAKGGKKP